MYRADRIFGVIVSISSSFVSMDNIRLHSFTTKIWLCLLLLLSLTTLGHGLDAGASCPPKSARRGRAQVLSAIPCDLRVQAYCNLPGTLYPWNAVRRFVHENQGLMKRMYGNIRHISVLRNEINNNDIGLNDVEQATARYSRSGWKRNKYLYTDYQKAKNNDVLTEPYFRRAPTPRTTVKTTFTTTKSSSPTSTPILPSAIAATTTTTMVTEATTTATAAASITSIGSDASEIDETLNGINQYQSDEPDTGLNNEIDPSIVEQRTLANGSSAATDENTNFTTNNVPDNIQIIGPPNLSAINRTEAATISTTLKMANFKPYDTTVAPLTVDEIGAQTLVATATELFEGNSTSPAIDEIAINITEPQQMDSNDDGNYEGDDDDVVIISKQANKTKPEDNLAATAQLFQDVDEKKEAYNFNSRGVNACPVKEEVVAPFWANNTRGEVLALLNLYPFEQYVHWEKCTNENKQMYCRDGCRCEQQYRLHRLLAYDPHNECRGIFSDWFRFPSCCICKCYDIPFEFRVTSRSPRSMVDGDGDERHSHNGAAVNDDGNGARHPIDIAEDDVQRAIYEHATEEEWYLGPRDSIQDDNDDALDDDDEYDVFNY